MQLKSNLNHVFTSFSTKPPNNYRIFCGNKQIQSKYIPILRYYHFTVPPPTALSKAPPPLRPHQPSQNRTIPRKALSHLPPLSKVRCCRPKKFGRLPEGLLPIRTNPPKPSLSLENRHHPRFLKSIQTKLKTAPVTLRERFNCILL